MRYLIFLLTFLSISSHAVKLDLTDLRQPKVITTEIQTISCITSNSGDSHIITIKKGSSVIEKCSPFWLEEITAYQNRLIGNGSWSSATAPIFVASPIGWYEYKYVPCKYGDCATFGTDTERTSSGQLQWRVITSNIGDLTECPPEGHPKHIHDYYHGSTHLCAKELKTSFCPDPSVDDLTVFTAENHVTLCFVNTDGSQCKINTGTEGFYKLPSQYASQESANCTGDPVLSDDPTPFEDPDRIADVVNDLERPEADDSDQTLDIAALNQINDNLKTLNDNLTLSSDLASDHSKAIKDNIDNSNLYLDEIAENTGLALGSAQAQTGLLEAINSGLFTINETIKNKPVGGGGVTQPCTGDNCTGGEEPITATAERKTGGLNSVFHADDLDVLITKSVEAEQELKDYYSLVKSEIKNMFDLQINASGAYETRTMNIKGQTIDYGLGRFASFWQALAPVILFIFSCLALYAVLGGLRD